MGVQYNILLSRFFTRFGDQAWDFAIPLILMELFPGNMKIIAAIYLISKFSQIVLGPSVTKKIDNNSRNSIYKIGIGSQTIAMALTWFVVVLYIYFKNDLNLSFIQQLLLLLLISALNAISNLGSSLMDIAVGFDLAVDVLPKNELTTFNSRLKRIDLFTEVTAPIFTGLMFSMFKFSPIFGFSAVACLNLITFLPEYYLLKTVQRSDNYKEKITIPQTNSANFFVTFINSIKDLKNKPYSLIIISYAFLWLSVLSPHGVLLTSYLKDGAKISEMEIGLFRGFGAIFGLIPTFLFARLKTKFNLFQTGNLFIHFQFVCVLFAFFTFAFIENHYLFLAFILLSRIGLYGFSIGETEIRQLLIPQNERGEANGIANATTSMATLILFLVASIFGDVNNFGYMIVFSVVAIFISLIIYSFLSKQKIINNQP